MRIFYAANDKLSWPLAAGVLFAALLAKLMAGLFWYEPPLEDPDAYRVLANHLLEEGVLGFSGTGEGLRPTAFRPPLFPLMLALVGWPAGGISAAAVVSLQVALGLLTVWLVMLLGQKWGLGRWCYLAGLLIALDPLLLAHSFTIMTEPLAALLAVLTLYGLTRLRNRPSFWWSAASGVLVALACLARPTFLPWLAVIALLLPLTGRAGRDRLLLLLIPFLLGAALPLGIWAARNQLQLGQPVVATTHGGYTLLWGNNSGYYRHLKLHGWRKPWDAEPLHHWFARERAQAERQHHHPAAAELLADKLAYERAIGAILQQPESFLWASAVRVLRLWDVMPLQLQSPETTRQRGLRYGVAFWYAVIYLLAALGVFRLRRQLVRPPWLWGLLLLVCFTAVHAVYWSDMRMRAPLMPFVVLLAAAGLQRSAFNPSEDRAGTA